MDSPPWVLTTHVTLGLKVKGQGHRVQKRISVEGDQVAVVSLHSVEWPSSSLVRCSVFDARVYISSEFLGISTETENHLFTCC